MHKVRLYPRPSQIARLDFMLHQTRHLYNAALGQITDGWRHRRLAISAKDQYLQLTELRAAMPQYASVYQECEAAVIRRLDIAMAAFFRRIKRGETPGYPRFASASRWQQLEFPHGDRAIKFNADQTKVKIPSLNFVSLRKGRAIPAFGRVFIVRQAGRWYMIFECQRDSSPLPKTGASVGIDRGVVSLVALSDVGPLPAPRFGLRLAAKLKQAQRRVSRRKKGSRRRRDSVVLLARLHESVANFRRDYAHKLSSHLVKTYDNIAIEKLNVRNMTRSAKGTVEEPGINVRQKAGLNRSILDAAWSMLKSFTSEKAAWAVRCVREVESRYSSQECSQCGYVDANNRRSQSDFICLRCGFRCNADWNAAIVIEKRAQFEPAGSCAGLPADEDLQSWSALGSTEFMRHDAA